MTANAANTTATIISSMRYEDAGAAIEWLCGAFGFEKRLVVPGDAGAVIHAELVFGNGMIMLGSSHDGGFDELLKPASEFGGTVSQSVYGIGTAADAHHARAVAAGAEVVMELKDQDYGGRGYSCHDPQGQVWSFGTYDPWA